MTNPPRSPRQDGGKPSPGAGDYPLRDSAADTLRTYSGRRLRDVTAEAIAAGELSGDDLRTHADALRQQAQIAREGGYPQLAANLERAAELTDVPNEELLRVYDILRPERASHDELIRLADYLERTYGAEANAAFVREAAKVYRERGLERR